MSFESIVMAIIGFFLGATLTILGVYALLVKHPVTFLGGKKIDPSKVSDVRKYNLANAKMWLLFSIPFWLAGIVGLFNDYGNVYSYIYLLLLIVGSSFGLMRVLLTYQKIASKYIS